MTKPLDTNDKTGAEGDDSFARQAEGPRTGFFRELWDFLREEKKWWLAPIIIVLILVGILAVLATNPATAPFLYTLW